MSDNVIAMFDNVILVYHIIAMIQMRVMLHATAVLCETPIIHRIEMIYEIATTRVVALPTSETGSTTDNVKTPASLSPTYNRPLIRGHESPPTRALVASGDERKYSRVE